MIIVLAAIELHPGARDAFLKEFLALVPLVRAEQGCLEYGPTLDVPAGLPRQVPYRENVVTIVEKWSDLAALQAHLVAPHMVAYRPRVKDLVKNTELQILEPVG